MLTEMWTLEVLYSLKQNAKCGPQNIKSNLIQSWT